jgi:predicted amidophosphoribosyltransferase
MKPLKKHVGWNCVRGKPDEPVYIDLCPICIKPLDGDKCPVCGETFEREQSCSN